MPGFNIAGGNNPSDPSITVGQFRDVHRAHRWKIERLGGLTTGDQGVSLYAKTLQLPAYNIEEEVVPGGAVKYKFAKMVNWEDVNISFYDIHGLSGALYVWQLKVFGEGEGIGLATDYKQDSVFRLIDGQGNNADGYVLIGSWPKNISHSPLSYETSDLKLINMTLSYDFAEYTFGGSTGQRGSG
jgi:hypothetical protein